MSRAKQIIEELSLNEAKLDTKALTRLLQSMSKQDWEMFLGGDTRESKVSDVVDHVESSADDSDTKKINKLLKSGDTEKLVSMLANSNSFDVRFERGT